MRKTPLSTPGGGNGRNSESHGWNPRDRRQGFDGSGGSGYGQFQGDVSHGSFTPGSGQPSPQLKGGDDFIPLGVSSPVNHRPRNNYGNWRGRGNPHRHRGTPPGSGGFENSHRTNFYQENSPRSNSLNESNSPKYFHRNYQNNHFGQRRPRQKDSHRHIDISNYLNVSSCLEDPWAHLMKNIDKSESFNEVKNESLSNCTASESSCGSILIGDLNVRSNSSNIEEDTPDAKIAAEDSSQKLEDEKATITSDATAETTS